MKCTIPEISWHNRDPVLSVDIQPKTLTDKSAFHRLASGGTDSHVLIWYVTLQESGTVALDVAADLTRHQRAVNAVRWSPSGELLASGDDESVIVLWKQKADTETMNILDDSDDQNKEIWLSLRVLRGHMEDVYDLSWSPDSLHLISGSVDNTAMVWDVTKGKSLAILSDHGGFVQGVAWDPRNQYLATLSTDRYLRVFDAITRKVVSRSAKCTLPVPDSSPLAGKVMRLFHDDTLQTFFRRLAFSPDGTLIVTPAGVASVDGVDTKPMHTSYIYSRYALKQPLIVLPCADEYSIGVRFCPVLFELRPHNAVTSPPVIPLPYRMVFAVATRSSVYLFDTQQKMPFGVISNITYTRLTDMTWSSDGRVLIVSSTDGFCAIMAFDEEQLGVVYQPSSDKMDEDVEPVKDDPKSVDAKQLPSTKTVETIPLIEKENLISSDEKFEVPAIVNKTATPIAIRRHPRTIPVDVCSPSTHSLDDHKENGPGSGALKQNEHADSCIAASVAPSSPSQNLTPTRTPRRVELTTLSTPKSKKKLL